MKVLIIGSRIPWPLHDGGAIATYNLLKGLSDAGVRVSYLSLNTKKHFVDETNIQREFAFLDSIQHRFIDTSISVWKAFTNLFSNQSYNIERFKSTEFARDIDLLLQTNAYDVIQFEGLFVAAYAENINVGIPMILRQHNVEFNIWKTLAESEKSFFKKFYLKLLANRMESFEKRIIQRFTAVVTITEQDQTTISKIGYNGILESIPAGIVKSEIKHDKIDLNSIYHIGSMEWMPNQDAMEWFHNDIWPRIISKNIEAKFYMAGKQMPEHYHLWQNDHFKVAGEVQNQDQFISNKSILVVPLKSGSGIRIKTIEAMMAGKVVVTTSQGAMGLPLVNNEHCLITNNEKEFADAILRLISNPELRHQIASNGQRFATDNYSNKKVSEKWLNFYLRLIG